MGIDNVVLVGLKDIPAWIKKLETNVAIHDAIMADIKKMVEENKRVDKETYNAVVGRGIHGTYEPKKLTDFASHFEGYIFTFVVIDDFNMIVYEVKESTILSTESFELDNITTTKSGLTITTYYNYGMHITNDITQEFDDERDFDTDLSAFMTKTDVLSINHPHLSILNPPRMTQVTM